MYLFRLLTQFSNHASVQFLPGHTPTQEERAQPQLYADNVRVALARGAGLPCCVAQLGSKWRLHKAIGGGHLHWKWYRNPGVGDPRKTVPGAVAPWAAAGATPSCRYHAPPPSARDGSALRVGADTLSADVETGAGVGAGGAGGGPIVVTPALSGAGTPRAKFWPAGAHTDAVDGVRNTDRGPGQVGSERE